MKTSDTAPELFPIVESPSGFRYLMDKRCKIVYTFFGQPNGMTEKHLSFPVVSYATCLFAWQRGETTPA